MHNSPYLTHSTIVYYARVMHFSSAFHFLSVFLKLVCYAHVFPCILFELVVCSRKTYVFYVTVDTQAKICRDMYTQIPSSPGANWLINPTLSLMVAVNMYTMTHCKKVRVISTLPELAQLHPFRSSPHAFHSLKYLISCHAGINSRPHYDTESCTFPCQIVIYRQSQ